MEVTKEQARLLTKELQKAVEAICKKHNLELSKQSAKFGDYFAYNIQAVNVKKDRSGINLASQEALLYQKYGYETFDFKTAKTIKLKAKIGKKFNHDGQQFVFAGIRGGSGKKQIVCISNKEKYLFDNDIIPLLNKK
jgi:prolyl oligopeptidase PreP (S9A serine peptidase family)